MERKWILIICIAFTLSIFSSIAAKAQQKVQVVEDKVIKVNLRKPPQSSDRYLDNNKPKKKLKTKIKVMKSWQCPSYLYYESKPQKNRDKMMRKRRKKINT